MGSELAQLLEQAIERKLGDDHERGDRGPLLDEIAKSAGIAVATLNEILSGEINCPPPERIEGFSKSLDLTLKSMRAALRKDGCELELARAEAARTGSRQSVQRFMRARRAARS